MPIVYSQAPGTADDTAFVQAEINALNTGDEFRIDRPVNISSLNWPLMHGTALTGYGGGAINKIPGSAGHLVNLPNGLREFACDKMAFDGARSSYPVAGTPRSIFFGAEIIDPVFERLTVANVIDAVVKLRQSQGVNVRYAKMTNIGQNGVELRTYPKNPATGLPWTVALRTAQHRIIGCTFVGIDSGQEGYADSNAITMDSVAWWTGDVESATDLARALPIQDVVISECFSEDVMRFFFSENYGTELDGLVISEWVGRNRIAGTYDTKNGIGLLGVKNATISTVVARNIGSMALDLANNDNTTAVFVGKPWSGVQNRNILVNGAVLVDDGGVTHGTDHQINVQSGDNISVFNSMAKGATDGNTVFNATAVTGLRTANIDGAPGDDSWGDTFTLNYMTDVLSANSSWAPMTPFKWAADANIPLPGAAELVAVNYRLSAPVTNGTFAIAPYVNGSKQSTFELTQADFGGGQYAGKAVSSGNGIVCPELASVAARYLANATFACAGGAFVTLTFNRARKL